MRHRDLLPLVALLAGWLAAMAVVVALVLDSRAEMLERGERETAALAEVMEQHTARSFQAALLVVRGIADGWWLVKPRPHDPAFQAVLNQRLADLEQASGIFVLNRQGRLIHDTNHPRTPDRSFADRPYFEAYAADPSLQTGVSGPYSSRSPGAGWIVAVTSRLGPTGELHGVVGAAVDAASFEPLYAKMAVTEGDVIALFHEDGTLIARHPPAAGDVGRSHSDLPIFAGRRIANGSGSYRGQGPMFAGKRIISYRAVEGLPLVVYISRREDAVLADWRLGAEGAAVAMGALTLLLGWVLVRELRRRRRRERERAQRAQSDKMEALGQLTGGIAHDFNNLLGVISNSLHLLALEDRRSAPHALDMARRSVHRGREMVARLLAFARRQPLQIKAADLNSLVTQAHPLVAQACGPRIELVLQLAPGLAPVLTDESQFEMALLNLVVNARDALGGTGRIVLRTAQERDGVVLHVEDEGPGMPPEVRQHAIEPFFTTKGEAGTGLGLAQVYGFMEQIGGGLEIDSAPGEGTRVCLRFALARRAAETAPR